MEVNGYTIEPGAKLSRANLAGANLVAANLEGAVAGNGTEWPEGFDWVAAGVEEAPNDERSELFLDDRIGPHPIFDEVDLGLTDLEILAKLEDEK